MLAYDTPTSAADLSPSSSTTGTLNTNLSRSPMGSTHISVPPARSAKSTAINVPNSHIWLVSGPAGCGKSSVATHIASSLNIPYIEGDDYHPLANIEKMSNKIPLTDADRWDWLTVLREEAVRRLADGKCRGVVLTCSALKRKYRDVMRVAPYYEPGVHLHFIYLAADERALMARVAARKGHYMGADMVRSQFQALEPPQPDETDVITIDVSKPLEEVMADAMAKVNQVMADD